MSTLSPSIVKDSGVVRLSEFIWLIMNATVHISVILLLTHYLISFCVASLSVFMRSSTGFQLPDAELCFSLPAV